jgi:hypothetical protein
VHLVGFIVRIYHNAWSPECQNKESIIFTFKEHNPFHVFSKSMHFNASLHYYRAPRLAITLSLPLIRVHFRQTEQCLAISKHRVHCWAPATVFTSSTLRSYLPLLCYHSVLLSLLTHCITGYYKPETKGRKRCSSLQHPSTIRYNRTS